MKNISTLVPPRQRASKKVDLNRFVDVSGVRTRYIEAGASNGGVPLLLIHGYNGSCDYFYPNAIPLLAAERHVIAPDLPGNGLSGRLPIHTLDTYVDFLAGLAEALGYEQVDLAGHSMGGQLAIAAVVRHPERFRKLVLIDSAGLPELVKTQWIAPIKMLADSSLRQVRLYPTFIKIGIRARTQQEGLEIIRRRSVRHDLKQLNIPTLIVWGSRDRVVPLEHGAFMAKHIAGARLAIIRGAGHMPFYEKPEECSRLILSFLRG
ncbi:MAG TPA: alpha/beta fold hydrolase [Chloroflexia bacterium]|nr:alpha/beta fold hydrolase [Chloroflexia bacterium]